MLRRLLPALVAEFRAIFGVLPLLHRPVWISWGLCFLAAFVGLLPGAWSVFAQLLVLTGLGLAGLFSGTLAKRIRRRKWVEFPDGHEVAPYLPQLITLLAGPPYFLAMLVLFLHTATALPGVLPTTGLLDSLLLALDNFIRTQVFFDAAECFHVRLGGEVQGLAGKSVVFLSRSLMNLVFIKLAVQLLYAAYYRAQNLGRGEDMLFTVKQEIGAKDVARVKDLCQQVGDSLRDAVDTLRRYHEEAGDKAAIAWRCLVTMKDYAIPYLKTRHRAVTGHERERIAKLIDRLDSAPAEEEKPPPTQPRLLIALAAGLVLGMAVSFVLSGAAALVVTVLMTALASWMLVGSRGWIDRLVRWRALSPSTPDRLVWLQLRWALCLLPLLVITWSRLFQLVAGVAPGLFGGADLGQMNYPSTLVFVLENLLHMQIFANTFEIYGFRIADLHQKGVMGGLLTFLLRLVLNLGVIGLLVSFGMVWFNRVFRKFAVSPNAELVLRQEVSQCGPQAAVLVGFHLREVRGFLVEQMRRQKDEAMLVALAASGFFKDVQADRGTSEETDDLAMTRMGLGSALSDQGRLEEAVTEYQAARELYERLVREGRDDLCGALATTRMGLGIALWNQGRREEAVAEYQAAREIQERLVREGRDDLRNDLAMTRMNIGNALANQGRLEEAVTEYQSAREIFERLVGEGHDDLRNSLAVTRSNLGNALSEQGRLEEAVAEYQAAREIRAGLVREGRDDLRNGLAMSRRNLATGWWKQGRLEESAAEFRAAGDIYEGMVREGRDDLRTDLAMTRMGFGLALADQGRLEEAVAEYQAAREIQERLVREGREDLRNGLAWMRMNIGDVLVKQGRLDEAVAEYQTAREIYEQLVREGRDDVRDDLAWTRMGFGMALQHQGRLDEAVIEYQAAREIRELLVRQGRDDLRNGLALTRMSIGVALFKQSRLDAAVAEYQAAREIQEGLVRDGQLQVVANLAMCWFVAFEAATKLSEQEAIWVNRSAFAFLRDLLPQRLKLAPAAFTEIGKFLRLAQESNICAAEAEALAVQFAPPPSLAGSHTPVTEREHLGRL